MSEPYKMDVIDCCSTGSTSGGVLQCTGSVLCCTVLQCGAPADNPAVFGCCSTGSSTLYTPSDSLSVQNLHLCWYMVHGAPRCLVHHGVWCTMVYGGPSWMVYGAWFMVYYSARCMVNGALWYWFMVYYCARCMVQYGIWCTMVGRWLGWTGCDYGCEVFESHLILFCSFFLLEKFEIRQIWKVFKSNRRKKYFQKHDFKLLLSP